MDKNRKVIKTIIYKILMILIICEVYLHSIKEFVMNIVLL